jgi:hypothetical protein
VGDWVSGIGRKPPRFSGDANQPKSLRLCVDGLTLDCGVLAIFRSHLAGGLLAAWPICALADPGYYVVTPYDNAGVRSIDIRYWTFKATDQKEYIWPELGFAYGVNSRWTTELFLSGIGTRANDVHASTLNWQNDVLLTQGELPVDVALHAQFIKERNALQELYTEWGPVLQTDVGRTQFNFNAFFAQAFHVEQAQPTELKYQFQVRHRLSPAVHVGVQGFGELGPWNHWSASADQSHRAGPALFGKIALGEGQAIKWQAAWLVGKTNTVRGHMFTMKVQYDF